MIIARIKLTQGLTCVTIVSREIINDELLINHIELTPCVKNSNERFLVNFSNINLEYETSGISA